MLYFHSWSGGKDSTASVILDHIHGLPPSEIVMSEVMFDKKRNISGELPEHMDFVHNVAVPKFEEWGYKVNIVRDEQDYFDKFYHIIKKSKVPERNGKRASFPLGGMCCINRDLKLRPIKQFYAQFKGQEFTQYVGIAIEEKPRLARLEGTNKVSLLAKYGYTEKMAYDLCKEYGLLSPIYSLVQRGGCWFCPNAKFETMARIKEKHPHLWRELVKLSFEDNLVSKSFKYGRTLQEVEKDVDAIIAGWNMERNQLTLFD